MPYLFVAHLIGVAAIALPLFSGFVTKSLSITATAEAHYENAWLCLLAATAGVFWVCGMQITDEVFLRVPRHNESMEKRPIPMGMVVAIGVAAFACLAIGLFPIALYRVLPYPPDYRPYTLPHVVAQLQLMGCAALIYAIARAVRVVPFRAGTILDIDWLYRRPLAIFSRAIAQRLLDATQRFKQAASKGFFSLLDRADQALADDGRNGAFASTGQMAMFAAVMLLIYLIVYYR